VTNIKIEIRSRLIEFVCRLFNKILGAIQKTRVPELTKNDLEALIQKPDAISIHRPKTAKYVRIDVGLSNDASHSVECLLDNEDRFIIGVEPHPENIKGLINGTAKAHSISLMDGFVRHGFNCKYIPDLRAKFIVINGAAGSSATPVRRKFYSAYPDKGNSSLYKIQSLQSTGNITDREFDVIEFPLSALLDQLMAAGFEFVETLKIDTEGHELEVLRGCGDNIRQILYCRVECFKGVYDNSRYAKRESQPAHIILGPAGYHDSATAIIQYLESCNFALVSSRPGDYVFLNRDLEKMLKECETYP
jgi:FkbM family methyltransferase